MEELGIGLDGAWPFSSDVHGWRARRGVLIATLHRRERPLFTRASVARMLCRMKTAEPAAEKSSKAKLRNSTVVFLVGNIEPTMAWYERLGFEARYFPPGFAILRRDDVEIFLQHHDGYVRPDDPGAREREAWNVYIETDNVEALFRELSQRPDVNITRGLCPQEYGQVEFNVTDPNGYVLVFAQPVRR